MADWHSGREFALRTKFIPNFFEWRWKKIIGFISDLLGARFLLHRAQIYHFSYERMKVKVNEMRVSPRDAIYNRIAESGGIFQLPALTLPPSVSHLNNYVKILHWRIVESR